MTSAAPTTVGEFERLLRLLCQSVVAFGGDLQVHRTDLRTTTTFQIVANPQDTRRLIGQKAKFHRALQMLSDQTGDLIGRTISIDRVRENRDAKETAALPAYQDNPAWPRQPLLGLLSDTFAILFECEVTFKEGDGQAVVTVAFNRGRRNIDEMQLHLMSELVKTLGMANGVTLITDYCARPLA